MFLADRGFSYFYLMDHINSLGHTYCIRFKKYYKVLIFDKKEGHKVWKTLDDLFAYQYHSNHFYDVEITENKYKANIVISKRNGVSEH